MGLALAFQLFMLAQPLDLLVDRVFDRDDAYYYFRIAQSIAAHGWATFDGIHASSGVQLLWTGLLVPLAWLFPDPEAYLRAVLGLCIAFNLCSAVLLYRFCRLIATPVAADIALVFFAGLLFEGSSAFDGIEYGLHLTVLLGIGISAWRMIVLGEERQTVPLALLLAANVWTRLDSAIVSFAVLLLAFSWLLRHSANSARRILQMSGIMALAGAAYIAVCLWLAGTPLPLSGTVKTYYAHRFFEGYPFAVEVETLARFWLKIQMTGPLALLPERIADIGLGDGLHLFSNPQHLAVALFGAAVVVGGPLLLLRDPAYGAGSARLLRAALFVLALTMVQSAVAVLVMKDFAAVTRHYYGLHALLWIVWGAILLDLALRRFDPLVARLGALVLVLGLAAANVSLAHKTLTDPIDEANYSVSRLRIAEQLNGTLPRDAVAAAWNAGALGYFLDRPVVNLDGLVNDSAFLNHLESGRPLLSYLRAEGVTYLIDHNQRDLTLRYMEERNPDEFRNGIRWSEVEKIGQTGAIFVLKLRD
ncbi:MAG: hypothetical protein KDE00_04400 [Rhodobacteraceae bacterium]|nr:hypothetical protein [Paracoccaceae bacterium]